jgi:hypothetical protein
MPPCRLRPRRRRCDGRLTSPKLAPAAAAAPPDPAAEEFKYPVSVDVKDLITLEDAMEEMGLGPNG